MLPTIIIGTLATPPTQIPLTYESFSGCGGKKPARAMTVWSASGTAVASQNVPAIWFTIDSTTVAVGVTDNKYCTSQTSACGYTGTYKGGCPFEGATTGEAWDTFCDCDWAFTDVPQNDFRIKVGCEMRNAKDPTMNGACIVTYQADMTKEWAYQGYQHKPNTTAVVVNPAA